MNEVASISSSCDRLDLLGIEGSSSFGNNNNNSNSNHGEDAASTTPTFQPGRGLSAAFGIDSFVSLSCPTSASSSIVTTSSSSTRPSLLANHRNRTNSDPMAGLFSTGFPSSLPLSINPNPVVGGGGAGAGGSSQASSSSSALPTCSPSPTGSGGGGSGGGGILSSHKQRFSPRRQVSYHPPSPGNRRSLSPLASAGPNNAGYYKRKIHGGGGEGLWGSSSLESEPYPKFPRMSLSRGSTPERGFPTPLASPGLSPKGGTAASSVTSAASQQPSGLLVGATVSSTSCASSSSISALVHSLPSSPSTPLPPSPCALSNNPFSRSTSPTPNSSLVGGGVGGGGDGVSVGVDKCATLPFAQDHLPADNRHLSLSSSSAESSFSSLDESAHASGLHFTGFTAAPLRSSSSSSSMIHFCMTPPSNGSPAPPSNGSPAPPTLPPQPHLAAKAVEDDGKFRWPSGQNGVLTEEKAAEGGEGKSGATGNDSVDATEGETMETDAS